MTATPTRRSTASATSTDPLAGVLIDQLTEAVAFPPNRRSRSVVVAELTTEIFEAIRWMHGPDADQEELASLYRVVAEAYAHRSRMAVRTSGKRG